MTENRDNSENWPDWPELDWSESEREPPIPPPPLDEWADRPRRLRWAIERQPREGRRRGLRLFQLRISERAKVVEGLTTGEKGIALSTIQSYLAGVEPPVLFLEEAARVLGVRAAWLAYGDGWPTDQEQLLIDRLRRPLSGIGRRLSEGENRNALAAEIRGFEELPHATRTAVLRGFEMFVRSLVRGTDAGAFDLSAAAHDYAVFLEAPLTRALGYDPALLGDADRALAIEAQLRVLEIALNAVPNLPPPEREGEP